MRYFDGFGNARYESGRIRGSYGAVSPTAPYAVAHTLAYDAAVMGDSTVPTMLISSIKVPTLILTGGNSRA